MKQDTMQSNIEKTEIITDRVSSAHLGQITNKHVPWNLQETILRWKTLETHSEGSSDMDKDTSRN